MDFCLMICSLILLFKIICSENAYPNRPTFHFVPVPLDWMNDPNGPFYDATSEKYHLFFQYGHPKQWGHAISSDLLRWINLAIAIPNNESYNKGGVWSGSTTQLINGPINNHQIYVMYAVNTNNLTCLAYPADPNDSNLTEWTNYPENCILNVTRDGCPGGRDPTHSWTADGGKTWIFTYNTLQNYQTTDWKVWTAAPSKLFHPPKGIEMPGFYVLPKHQQFENATHIIKASRYKLGDWWSFGTYNITSTAFIPYQGNNESVAPLFCSDCQFDFGSSPPSPFYASKAFYDSKNDRLVLFGWLKEQEGQNNNGWQGAQSLPRTITLLNVSQSPTGYPRIISYPIKEFDSLRIQSTLFTQTNLTIDSGQHIIFPMNKIGGNTLDIMLTWEGAKSSDCGVYVMGNATSANNLGVTYTRIGINYNLKAFYVQPKGQNATQQVVAGWDGVTPIKMRIIVDHSIIETFINDGVMAATRRVYQNLSQYSVGVYAFDHGNGDKCDLISFNAWNVTTVIQPPP